MPVKKYEAKFFAKLSIPVRIGSRVKRIEFKGGTSQPRKRGGTFITDDPVIQRALERRGDFGRKFICVQSTLTRAEQEAENKALLDDLKNEDVAPVAPEVPVEEPKESPGETVNEVTKFQEAKLYLYNKFEDVSLGDVRSKVLVREVAKKRKITFPNWPEE